MNVTDPVSYKVV